MKRRRRSAKQRGSDWRAPVFREPRLTPHKSIYLAWGALFAITLCLGGCFHLISENRVVYDKVHELKPGQPGQSGSQVVFSDPIELKSRRNLQVRAYALVDNSWAWVGGDFINEETGKVEKFELPIEYYFGATGGERWTEGDWNNQIYIASLPAGRYTLRLEFQWERYTSPLSITVIITQGVSRTMHFSLALLGVSIIPIFLFMLQRGWFNAWPTIQRASLMLSKIYLALGFAIVLFYALTGFFGYEYGL
jgi:hypothetical protein